MGFKCDKVDICPYKKELDALKEEIALLRFELEELKSKRCKPKKPPQDIEPPTASAKKKGGLFGHAGWFRPRPKSIDEIEAVRLDRCPRCGCKEIIECKGIRRAYPRRYNPAKT